MVMRLFCCLLLLSAMPSWAATKLEASVDKNPVLAGEFFMLNISVDDTIKSGLSRHFAQRESGISSPCRAYLRLAPNRSRHNRISG